MDKHEVAAILYEIAQILDLKGENPFKVRAYENAARTIDALTENLATLVNEGGLTQVKGIGKNLSDHIVELLKTGRIKEYEKLLSSIPEGVKEMLKIPGLGPRKVRVIWEVRKINSIGELEMACKRHMLKDTPGFGEKTEEKILKGIESIKKFAGQRLFSEAFIIAKTIHREISMWPEVTRSEIAGSLRRKKEIVKDIDILAATEKPQKVMERFVSLPQVEEVIQHGQTKSEVLLKSGIQCDLRAITEREFPFALHYFTGSKDHNVAMRTIAKRSNMKMNEYGLFKGKATKSLPCRDERAIFKTLNMAFIEPELREDMGEIDAAIAGKLPKLVESADLKGVMHVHTNYTDGAASVAKMAAAARERGYEYILISDHSKAVTIAHGLKPADVKRQFKEIDALNRKATKFKIFKGIEVDILSDGTLDFDDDLLAMFDVVIAAIHSRFNMGEAEMTARIIAALKNPNVDILAHPTGRLLLAREPYAVDLKAVIEVAADLGKALELNAHPQRLDLDWRWCKYAKEKGVKIAICPDAHTIDGLDDIAYGVGIARKGWLEKTDVLNCLGAEQLVRRFGKNQ